MLTLLAVSCHAIEAKAVSFFITIGIARGSSVVLVGIAEVVKVSDAIFS